MEKITAIKQFRLIKYAGGDAATNMAADEAIFIACQQKKSGPTLRFYSWSPPAVSAGYGQKIRDALDLEKCFSMGITIIRRPTGGKAVLHSGDLSYSFVVPQWLSPFNGAIKESYKFISDCFARGLGTLQVDVEVADKKIAPLGARQSLSALCFSTFSAYDICHGGKKLMGSAQKRQNGMILQHGSIFLDVDWDLAVDVLKPCNGLDRAQAVARLKEEMTSLNQIAETEISKTDVADALAEGVQKHLGVELREEDFTPYEKELMERLRAEKYSSAAWCFAR